MNEGFAAFHVIGSQSPWLESILLSLGASQITTFDYIKIKSEHSQIEAERQRYRERKREREGEIKTIY
jgi:hypothetical protein